MYQLAIGNPQGIAVDHLGAIWSVEHGARGGDELNRVREGGNAGWPLVLVTFGTRYDREPIGDPDEYGRHARFDAPAFAWVPSIGTSSVAEVQGFDPRWDGDLLVTSLHGGTLFRIRLDATRNHVKYAEPVFVSNRIRYVLPHSDGRIGLWMDDARLIWLAKDDSPNSTTVILATASAMGFEYSRQAHLRENIETCLECHSFSEGTHLAGPSLNGLLDRRIASTGYAGYSAALLSVGGDWTPERLTAYLNAPDVFAPGTVMADQRLSKEDAVDLVSLIRRAQGATLSTSKSIVHISGPSNSARGPHVESYTPFGVYAQSGRD